MVREEIAIGQVFCGHRKFLTFDATEMLVVILLRLVLPQGGREDDAVVVGRDGDEALVKGFVVEGGEADAVAGVQAFLLVRLV